MFGCGDASLVEFPQWRFLRFLTREFVVFWLLAVHAGLLLYAGYQDAPTELEIAHLPAGISHWETGCFYFFRQNPPLVRLVAALPVLCVSHKTDWTAYGETAGVRPEFWLGHKFLEINRPNSAFLFTVARWACIPFSLLGGWICFLWARDVFGYLAGIVALSLWCFSPMTIGHGHLINPDVASASLGIAAAYTFWRWLRDPTWRNMATAGCVCGLALLTKLTWIILLGLWPCLWLCWLALRRTSCERRTLVHSAVQLPCLLLLALLVLNTIYGFEGSFRRLGDFEFVSQALSDVGRDNPGTVNAGNRFHDTWLGTIPVPFPRYYIEGIDIQAFDFERPWDSYLGGEWRKGSWWYYYLYAAAVKLPAGTLLLFAAALFCFAIAPSYRLCAPNELVLILPALVIVLLCSSQSTMGLHFRYVLPAFPFLYVWISRVGISPDGPSCTATILRKSVLIVSISSMIASSLVVYPYSISFFNVMAGGPQRGWQHLLGSNLDWGQDILRLRTWQEQQSRRPSLKMALASYIEPEDVGLKGQIIEQKSFSRRECKPSAITAGWYAISVDHLYGRNPLFSFFRRIEPEASIGYTIRVYHLSAQQAASIQSAATLVRNMKRSINRAAEREKAICVAVLMCDDSERDSVTWLSDLVERSPLCACERVTPENVSGGALKRYDVILVPGGSATAKAVALGVSGKAVIRDFVADGGGYVGICGGAFLATLGYGVDIVDEKTMRGEYRALDGTIRPISGRGVGTVAVEMTPAGSEIFPTIGKLVDMQFANGPIISEWKGKAISNVVSLANYRSEMWQCDLQKNTMIGTPAIAAAKYGKGCIILFGPHPEVTPDIEKVISEAVKAVAPAAAANEPPWAIASGQ